MALDTITANTLYANIGIVGYEHPNKDSTIHVTHQYVNIQELKEYKAIVAEILNEYHEQYLNEAMATGLYYDGSRDEIVEFLDSLDYGAIVPNPYNEKAVKWLLYDFEVFCSNLLEMSSGTHWSKEITSSGYIRPTEFWRMGERVTSDKNRGCQASWSGIASQETQDQNSYTPYGDSKQYSCYNEMVNEMAQERKASVDRDKGYVGTVDIPNRYPVDSESSLTHPIVEQSCTRPVPEPKKRTSNNIPTIVEINNKEFEIDSRPVESKLHKTRKYPKKAQQRSKNLVRYYMEIGN